MAHKVTFSIPTRELGRADITFNVTRGNQKLGTLKISRGSLVWYPRDHTYGHKIRWTEFDIAAQEYPREERR